MRKTQATEQKTPGAITSILNAVAGLVSRKNATDDQADSNPKADAPSEGSRVYAETLKKLAEEKRHAHGGADPAHAPGHRKLGPDGTSSHLNSKNQPQNASAMNNNAKADVIHKNESSQRKQPDRGLS